MMKRILALFALILLLALPSSASAHQPIWGDASQPMHIEHIATSYAFYQTLPADAIHVFYFEGRQGETFRAGINIPDIPALKNFGVSIALFGRGFPQPEKNQLPREYPPDLGSLIYPSQVSADFFEPITQAYYWGRQDFSVTLPADGTYYLLVWQPEGKAGKYVLDTGADEDFGVLDIFRLPVWWVRVQLFQEYYARLAIVSGAVVLAIAFLIYRYVRRRYVH